MTKPARADVFFTFSALVSRSEKRALAIPSWETISVNHTKFSSYFCGANKRGVFVGISGAMATVTMTKFLNLRE